LEKLKVDSIVYSDGWKAYNKLSLNGFHHRRINHDNHDKTLVGAKQRPRELLGLRQTPPNIRPRRLQTQLQALYQGVIDYLKSILIGP
jgi:transposase-like protein